MPAIIEWSPQWIPHASIALSLCYFWRNPCNAIDMDVQQKGAHYTEMTMASPQQLKESTAPLDNGPAN
jgi:hypothetical protein